jgi:hypothetical protein
LQTLLLGYLSDDAVLFWVPVRPRALLSGVSDLPRLCPGLAVDLLGNPLLRRVFLWV